MRTSSAHHRRLLACLLLSISASMPVRADELRLDARKLFTRSVTHQLRLAGDGDAIELQTGTLFEDDGPAAGFSYRPNEEKLDGGVWIKKELLIPAPQARQATLLVGRGGDLAARINGKPVVLDPPDKQGHYWQAYRFPPDVLRQGKNEFVLSGTGSVWIARDDEYAAGSLTRRKHPNRSAKSVDEGRTWNDTQLGTQNNIDGEYYVRVFLDQYQAEGKLALAVIDVGNLSEKAVGPPVAVIGPIHIASDIAAAENAAIELRARTGTSFVPGDKGWSDWSDIGLPAGAIEKPFGRYLQIEATFSTNNPLKSPGLKALTISASPRRPNDWTKDLRIVEYSVNPSIVRSSIPFEYEPFDRPELAELRRKYELDAVVSGADTEFELMKRLAVWSATRWQRMHLKESYPPYNALEILQPHADGTPVGGFCQQYNVVFLQACESFGLVGRLVSIGPGNLIDKTRGGHEAVEIWSNEYQKWVYIDGNTAWYAVDRETKEPLSLLQLRERLLAESRGEEHRPIEPVILTDTKYDWPTFMHWARLVELRLIPRSNFLEQKSPLPLNQGMRGWFWAGHYVWTDEQPPARMIYSNRISKRDNFEWTLNQAHVFLEATANPGKLRVHVGTNTPGLEGLFATIDKRREERVSSPFEWTIKPGIINRLHVVPRNTAGRDGIPASVSVLWESPAN